MGIKNKGVLVLRTVTAYWYCVLGTAYWVLVLRTRIAYSYSYCARVMEIGHGKEKKEKQTSGTHAGALSVEKLKLKGKLKREIEKGNLKGTNTRGI